MSRPKQLGAVTLALIVMSALCGCAAYRKCGLRGCPGDAQITSEVRGLLDQYPALGPPNLVWVRTLDRVVYLSGQVDTELQRQSAESVAHKASGVARVVNSIGVSNGAL
jgi:osmotically-inducible protein OsmY